MNRIRCAYYFRKPILEISRFYAAPAKNAPAAAPAVKEDLSFIDMDTEKLTTQCCCNYLKEGTDIKLKSDNEYPAWLFKLRLGPLPKWHELDPSDMYYWQLRNEASLKEREERKYLFYRSTFTQLYLRTRKDIPEEDYK